MTKPCHQCAHYETGHYCKKKQAPTERARIMGTERSDCWVVKVSDSKKGVVL